MTRLLRLPTLTLALLLGLAAPALAAPKDEVGALLFGPWLLALVAFPIGLALHLLILGYAPRRGAGPEEITSVASSIARASSNHSLPIASSTAL